MSYYSSSLFSPRSLPWPSQRDVAVSSKSVAIASLTNRCNSTDHMVTHLGITSRRLGATAPKTLLLNEWLSGWQSQAIPIFSKLPILLTLEPVSKPLQRQKFNLVINLSISPSFEAFKNNSSKTTNNKCSLSSLSTVTSTVLGTRWRDVELVHFSVIFILFSRVALCFCY